MSNSGSMELRYNNTIQNQFVTRRSVQAKNRNRMRD